MNDDGIEIIKSHTETMNIKSYKSSNMWSKEICWFTKISQDKFKQKMKIKCIVKSDLLIKENGKKLFDTNCTCIENVSRRISDKWSIGP